MKVFEFPQLKQADAHLKYPDFTGPLPEKDIPNTRIVTAVEGTNATLTFKLNKSVAEATPRPPLRVPAAYSHHRSGGRRPARQWRSSCRRQRRWRSRRQGRPRRARLAAAKWSRRARTTSSPTASGSPNITLTKDPNDPTAYTVKMDMLHSQLYTLQLVDSDKRANREKPTMAPQRHPRQPRRSVRLTAPGRDVEVSPLEELTIKGQVSDDFGVKRVPASPTPCAVNRRKWSS